MSTSHSRFFLVFRMPPLWKTLRADAAVCLATGAVLLVAAAPLAPVLARDGFAVAGLDFESFARLVGAAVLAIGAGVYAVSRARRIRPAAVAPILAVEVVWIAASAALLVIHGAMLTAAGVGVVLTGAVAVLGFLVAEWLGLRAEPHLTRETARRPSLVVDGRTAAR